MSISMPVWLKQLLTENDDSTPDIAVILWAFGSLAFVLYAGYDLAWLKHEFKPQDYGVGFAALLAGGAASLWGKSKADAVTDKAEK